MAITTFTELETAIENWLNENGNIAVQTNTSDFIMLAEVFLRDNKEFRPRYLETRTTLTCVPGVDTLALPNGFLELGGRPRLNISPPVQLRTTVQSDMDDTNILGIPRKCVIEGQNLRIAPSPASNYTISLLFYQFPTALSITDPSNLILVNQPNIYLWASLLQAAIYIKDDAQIEKFSTLVTSAISNKYQADQKARYAAPLNIVNQYLSNNCL